MARRQPSHRTAGSKQRVRVDAPLRITGGELRGRRIDYAGLLRTRPMKERIRQAVFNMLAECVEGRHVIDLFAGTGALGLEALSRGATSAIFLEQHAPTAAAIRANCHTLGLEGKSTVIAADTFAWLRANKLPESPPWLVFCSPPYDYYEARRPELVAAVSSLIDRAPADSVFVIEAPAGIDPTLLPRSDEWTVRRYGGIIIAVLRLASPVDSP